MTYCVLITWMKPVRKTAALVLLGLFLASPFLLAAPKGEAQSTVAPIRILADGSIDPANASISRAENLYTLTGDLNQPLQVERDSTVIDGAGHTLMGQVRLEQRRGVTVKNLKVQGGIHAFYLYKSSDNSFTGNTVVDCGKGFYMWLSDRNSITGNSLVRLGVAFDFIDKCPYNTITGNSIRDCGTAIDLRCSNTVFSDNAISGCSDYALLLSADSNVLRNNSLSGNRLNFDVSAFNNNVDQSNSIDGKPIIFWKGRHDETVPSTASYVALLDCNNIQVHSLKAEGIVLLSTYNSSVKENAITRSKSSFESREPIDDRQARYIVYGVGIRVIGSQNNNVSGNIVWGKDCGIKLTNSAGINVAGNNLTDNGVYGLMLEGSNDNIVEENDVTSNGFFGRDSSGVSIVDSQRNRFVGNNVEGNCEFGIRLIGSQRNNSIFHNNFVDNRVSAGFLQVSMMGPVNPSAWDNGEQGNYWSDYKTRYPNASEVPGTGTGNTPFYINENNQDNHPLIAPYNVSANASKPSPVPSPSSPPCSPPSETPSLSNSPTPQITPSPSGSLAPLKTPEPSGSFAPIILVAGLVVLATVLAGVVFYFVRHRRNQQSMLPET
jgi:parallel beta-helix repeat protein